MMKSLKKSLLPVCLSVLLLPLSSASAQDQEQRVRELERKLEERDKVILELLERVDSLEQRVGVRHDVSKPPRAVDGEEDQPAAETADSGGKGVEGAPGRVAVDPAHVERALERALTRTGALLLSRGILEIEPGLRYARKEDRSPFLREANGRFFVSEALRNTDSFTADAALRLGLPWDAQLEMGMPYRWRDVETVEYVGFAPAGQSSRSGGGLGDLRLGIAKTLLREGVWQPDLVGRITWDTDSGERFDDGVALGSGFNEIRGSLTAITRQDPLVFVGGLAYEYSFEEEGIQPGSVISANLGSFLALSPENSLSFLFTVARQDESELFGETITGSERLIATLGVGGSTLLAPGILMNLSVDIGVTDDADDFAVSLSFPFRFDQPLY